MQTVQSLLKEFPALKSWQIENVINLIDEGNTIPFIARYRKEKHGELDDQTLRELSERLAYIRSLNERREEIKASLIKLEQFTPELEGALDACTILAELEDVYRPYKPKRRTRAMIAKEKGLEPLSIRLLEQNIDDNPPIEIAADYIDDEKGVLSAEEALEGAMDIIAERFSDDSSIRARLRDYVNKFGVISTKASGGEDSVYRMYYDYKEPVSRIAPHRVLAIDRGEREGFLKVSLELDQDKALELVEKGGVKPGSPSANIVKEAARDGYTRLIFPAIEREIRTTLTEKAQENAIRVFAVNLNNLLLQPPIKGEVVLGLDPGIRTGCKLAVVDNLGRVLDTGVIYPMHGEEKIAKAKETIINKIQKHGITLCAIGNGTASRETERFFIEAVKGLKQNVPYVIVNEAGASVYSASKLAAEEFPDFDVSIRSAVSIARRLQDPLSELVKIDPSAIGVGQYQHDLKTARLNEALGGVVERCVNEVGVELNTASASLLRYVSGISWAVAQNIEKYRKEKGAFKSRAELKLVPKLGPKAFEQCAGFIRVADGIEPLDNTGVHPESYEAARKLLKYFKLSDKDVTKGNIKNLEKEVEETGIAALKEAIDIGEFTLRDMVKELMKPGRDPRDELPKPLLCTDIMEIKDLKPGMELKGTVRNVTDFGAFVDIGVHRDGLVHISRMCERRINHPGDVVKVGDIINVWVEEVEEEKNRISLTMLPFKKA